MRYCLARKGDIAIGQVGYATNVVDSINVLSNLTIWLGAGTMRRDVDEPSSWLSPSSLLSFSPSL